MGSTRNETPSVVVIDEDISLPSQITPSTKPLPLIAHGITDIEIHFLQIKFTAIGIYFDPNDVVSALQQWKGKSGKELEEDDEFFAAVVSASAAGEKLIRVVVIKEIKGSQYGVQLESAVRDRLSEVDKYEDEEEVALEKVSEFFQSKYFKKGSVVTFYFPAAAAAEGGKGPKLEIGFAAERKEEAKLAVENANVAETIQKWYLGGSRGVSPTTISALANSLAGHLGK